MSGRKISLCMIVKNEESFLPGCLESVKNIVDEIIVVDTGSTDRTVEIAKSYGAKVYHFKWQNDFSSARNEALKHATGEWILVMDADERLLPGQEGKIRRYINLGYDGIYVKIVNKDKNGKIESFANYPRLFRKKEGVKFKGKIHEQIGQSIVDSGGKLVVSDIVIEHLGYGQDEETMERKFKRNLAILEDEIKENPNNAFAYYNIGVIQILLGNTDDGLSSLKKALSIPPEKSNLNDGVRAVIHNIMGKAEFRRKNYELSIKSFKNSLNIAPDQITAPFYLGENYYEIGDYQSAVTNYLKALKLLDTPVEKRRINIAFENDVSKSYVNFKLGCSYFKLGNRARAERHFLTAVEDETFYFKTLEFLVNEFTEGADVVSVMEVIAERKPSFEIYKKLAGIFQVEGNLERAKRYLEKALEFSSDDTELKYNLALCLTGLKNYEKAREVLLDVVRDEKSSYYEQALNLLGLINIAGGNLEEAFNCYKILLARNPENVEIQNKIKAIYFTALQKGIKLPDT